MICHCFHGFTSIGLMRIKTMCSENGCVSNHLNWWLISLIDDICIRPKGFKHRRQRSCVYHDFTMNAIHQLIVLYVFNTMRHRQNGRHPDLLCNTSIYMAGSWSMQRLHIHRLVVSGFRIKKTTCNSLHLTQQFIVKDKLMQGDAQSCISCVFTTGMCHSV